jgi:hypothetical protein
VSEEGPQEYIRNTEVALVGHNIGELSLKEDETFVS